MAAHKWRKRRTKHFGEVWVPFASVELRRADGKFQPLVLQVDSGAVVSLLRRSVANVLGLTLEGGRRVEMTSLGGAVTAAFVHELQTRLAVNIAYPVPFAIADSENVPNLLGRLGVFGPLQIDFDGTTQQTTILPPWLEEPDRQIWDFVNDTTDHILSRWPQCELPKAVQNVAARFINRAGQVMASVAGLLKLHRTYGAPALIRAMFELSLQFEYLMADPAPRAKQYTEFTHVTRHKWSSALASNPSGTISKQMAESPMRGEGEKRNVNEYNRVRPRFQRADRQMWSAWYCMSIHDLAKSVGRPGEYRLVYKSCAAWAHGDPFSTERVADHPFTKPNAVFMLCIGYYARMLLKLAEVGRVILSSEQFEALKHFEREVS